MKIYKIPGVYIVGFLGEFGVGKSLSMVRHALILADFYRRPIVSNLRLNAKALRFFAKKNNLRFAAQFLRVRYESDPLKLLSATNSIIAFDEVGIDLFSRSFAEKGRKALIDRIVRPRHYRNVILYTSQGKEQIDKQLRERTNLYCWCRGFAPYRPHLGRSDLKFSSRFYFNKATFENFDDKFALSKWIYPYWASGWRFEFNLPLIYYRFPDWCGWLNFFSSFDSFIFKCYHSFDSRQLSAFSSKIIKVTN